MKTEQLSMCFCTDRIEECRSFYVAYFGSQAVFDCGWYVTLRINHNGPEISFIQPQENMSIFGGAGVMLNFKVDDVDSEHLRLTRLGVPIAMPLEDHPWGDRGFSVVDPIGNTVYLYSDREPSDEFKQYFSQQNW